MISDYDPMILKLGALVNVREECDILYLLKMYELSIGIISDDAMVRSRGDPQVDGPILEMQNAAKNGPIWIFGTQVPYTQFSIKSVFHRLFGSTMYSFFH